MCIAEQHFGFMPGRSTTDAIFGSRMLLRSGERSKGVDCVLIDLRRPLTGYQEKF